MEKDRKVLIPKLDGHHCFACGTANPIGLNLQFYKFKDSVCADITLSKDFEGWEKIAHGGILSTMMDEIMSWTILYFKRVFFVTRKMEIKYIRPVIVGTPLTVKGTLTDDKSNERIIKVKAEILDDKENIMTRSTGEFVVLSDERLSAFTDSQKDEMFSLFKKMDRV